MTKTNRLQSVGMLAIGFAMAGCSTELKVQRYFDSEKLPTAGAPYSLAFTQYEITTIRRLVACSSKGDPNDPDPEKQVDKPINPKVGIKVNIKSAEARDPMRSYVIDLESLDSFFKTTSATVAYHDNGAIKSLNASAEDKTGEFISSVASTFGTLIDAGIKSVGILAATTGAAKGCSDQTKLKLAELELLEKSMEDKSAAIENLSGELTKLNALVQASKDYSSKGARDQLGKMQVRLMKEMEGLATATKKAAVLIDELSETSKINWPDNGETLATVAGQPAIPNLDKRLFDSWINPDSKKKYEESAGDAAIYEKLADKSAIHLKIKATDKMGRSKICAESCPDDGLSGFKYRIPAQGQLLVCSDPACTKETLHKAGDIGMISQLGHVYVLPLKSTMFSTKTISATFTENGTPTSLGVTSAAASDKAASTFGALGSLAATAHKSRAEKDLNELKTKTELLKAQKDYADATAALLPSPVQTKLDSTNAFKIDTDLINANLAYLNAKKALDEANKTLGIGTP